MVNSSSPNSRLVTAAALLFALLVTTSSVPVLAAKINITNHCGRDITACDCDGTFRVTCYALTAGGQSQVEIDVGATWVGVIWGFPNDTGDGSLGYQAFIQANSVEFTIDAESDFYSLSNANAYNLPVMVKPSSNQTCPSFSCTIDKLKNFCQAPNSLTGGPGWGCKNADGTKAGASDGNRAFSAACPGAISYSGDTRGNVIGSCENGGNYEVAFCP